MSLDEILKSPDGSSVWKTQRSKLIRLTGVLVALTAVLVAAGLIFFASEESSNTPNASTEVDAESLESLMRIQRDAERLQADLKGLNETSSSLPRTRAIQSRNLGSTTSPIISYDPGEGFTVLHAEKPGAYIPTGAVFRASLVTPIKTSVQKTFVIAESTHEFRMDQKRKIPKGSRLIGRSHLDPILKGVIVEFDTLVVPNGMESSISALALSRNALPELEGLYFSDRLTTYGTALAFGFLSGFSDAAREREGTAFGSQPTVSVANQVLGGLSTASFQVANDMLRDIKQNSIDFVVVPAGELIFVALTQRYQMEGL